MGQSIFLDERLYRAVDVLAAEVRASFDERPSTGSAKIGMDRMRTIFLRLVGLGYDIVRLDEGETIPNPQGDIGGRLVRPPAAPGPATIHVNMGPLPTYEQGYQRGLDEGYAAGLRRR